MIKKTLMSSNLKLNNILKDKLKDEIIYIYYQSGFIEYLAENNDVKAIIIKEEDDNFLK